MKRKPFSFFLLLALFGTVATAAFRALTTLLIPSWTVQMHWNYGWIALLAISAVILLIVDRKQVPRVSLTAQLRLPFALVQFFCGFLLLFTVLGDAFLWFDQQQLSPPSVAALNRIETILWALQIVCGVCGGLSLIADGWNTVNVQKHQRKQGKFISLMPALWAWMFLARYEMSYVSALDIGMSFYDFALLITTLVFLYLLAKYQTFYQNQRPRWLLAFSVLTAIFNLSAGIYRAVLLIAGRSVSSYQAGHILTLPHIGVGLLALVTVFVLVYGKTEPKEQAENITETEAE